MSHKSAARRFARLVVESLETREVPANNLTVVAGSTDSGINVKTQAHTVTISTTAPNAQLSLGTIQAQLTGRPNVTDVVITTAVANGGTDGHQSGDIAWDGTVAGNLDFTGFGTGETLHFQTVAGTNAIGNIDLTAVGFHNSGGNDELSLAFDTSATNGSIDFNADNTGTTPVSFDNVSVADLTVDAGTGGFSYEDATDLDGADAGGSVSITAGDVSILYSGGIAAGGDVTVNAATVSLESPLTANGNLSVTGATSVDAGNIAPAPLTATNGSASVSGGTVTLFESDLSALTTTTVSGSTSVDIDSQYVSGSGDVTITGGSVQFNNASVDGGGNVTISGTGVTVSGTGLSATGDLGITGSVSVSSDSFSTMDGADVTLSTAGSLTLSDLDLTATADASLTGLTVDMTGGTLSATGDLAVTATAATPQITLTDTTLLGGGNVTLTGAVDLGGTSVAVLGTGRNSVVAFTSSVDGAADLEVAGGTVTFWADLGRTTPIGTFTIDRGVVDLGNRNLNAAQVQVGTGTVDPLGLATLAGTGTITLTGFGAGTQTATLFINAGGDLAPGGLGTVGTLTVLGDVDFNGGIFAVDLGPTSDELVVKDNPATSDTEGNVTIDANNGGVLGGGLGTGTLPSGSGDVRLIDFDTAFNGEFSNAPLGTPLLAGTDAIEVTNYGPAAVGMTVAPVAALPTGVFSGADPDDGTLFTATLTGGGKLVVGTDINNSLFMVVRDSTPASKLTVTTKANGSDTVVTFGAGVLINGPLAGFAGPRVNIGTEFRATGAVKTVAMRDLVESLAGTPAVMSFGGLPINTTTITARNILGSVKTTATLSKLTATGALGAGVSVPGAEDSTVTAAAIGKVTAGQIDAFINTPGAVASVASTGDFFGGVTAASLGSLTAGSSAFGGSIAVDVTGAVGAITGKGNALTIDVSARSVGPVKVAKGILNGNGAGWHVAGGVAGITAVQISGLDLKARNLGAVNVPGTADLAGNITNSTFTLTGNDGSAAKVGLKSLTAAGTVLGTTIDAEAGNVGAVKVGRFLFSKLYVGYTPGAAFNTGGAFSNPGFNLTSFTTTAVPTPDPNNPFQWAYRGSEVAATAIGTVTLSGLDTDNGGTAFGIKVHKAGTVVTVKAADVGFPAALLGKALTLSATAVGGDFYFVKV